MCCKTRLLLAIGFGGEFWPCPCPALPMREYGLNASYRNLTPRLREANGGHRWRRTAEKLSKPVGSKNSSEARSPFKLPPDGNSARVRPVARGIEHARRLGRNDEAFRKKAHRRPDEKVQSSQANSGCMLSGARRVHPVIVGWSTANRPLIPSPSNDDPAAAWPRATPSEKLDRSGVVARHCMVVRD